MKKIIILTLLCVTAFVSCKNDNTVAVSGIKLDQTTLSLIEGGTSILTATITPDNAEDKTIDWSSDNENVATVSNNGEVTAIKTGIANITAKTTDGNQTATCIVTVNATPRIGDYYYSDGSWSTTLDANKNVIGIVFQTNPQRIGQGEITALGRTPLGLVMSVKAISNTTWGNSIEIDEELQNVGTLYSCYNDLSGLANSQTIWTKPGVNLSDYPAFKVVKEFREASTTKAPAGTTGWFLPSMGQLWDILENLGGLENTLKGDRNNLNESKEYDNVTGIAVENINKYLNNVEGAEPLVIGTYLLSSSEQSERLVRRICFTVNSEGMLYLNMCNKNISNGARCCLAF